MTAATSTVEHLRIDVRTRRAQGVSLVVHALVLMWMALHPHLISETPAITEITWIDPEALLQPAQPEPAQAPEPVKEVAPRSQPKPQPQQFERREPKAEVAPRPQSPRAVQDRLSKRLASLQRSEHQERRPAALEAPTPVSGVKPVRPSEPTRAAPLALKRDAGKKQPPVPLVRASNLPSTPRLAQVKAPTPETASSRPKDVDRSNVRNLAGASLMGPVADRPLRSHSAPEYPEWAKAQGVEASVSLYFVVRPDGSIKENIFVEKTSGYQEFDANAVAALRSWRFAPLGPGVTGEQWGTITFHFRLRAR
ncbi:MAG: TonB family protein [Candidatus Latescibacterota bacterium]|nr:MAG: TonB family protein [Candidatus Latescibacterota bacterium]